MTPREFEDWLKTRPEVIAIDGATYEVIYDGRVFSNGTNIDATPMVAVKRASKRERVIPAKRIAPTEYDEQVALFAWIVANTERYPCLALAFHPANGEYRLPATAGRLKAMGVRAGVPDVVVGAPAYLFDSHRRYSGIAIELKRADHSNGPTPEQLFWLARLEHYGWYCYVAYGAEEAIEEVVHVPS